MDHQLSNALSTMFLRRLVKFLHFDTYVLQNPQKKASSQYWVYQLSFFPHIYLRNRSNFVRIYVLHSDRYDHPNTWRSSRKSWRMRHVDFGQQNFNTFSWMWNFGSKFWGAIMLWSSEFIKPTFEQSIFAEHAMLDVTEK